MKLLKISICIIGIFLISPNIALSNSFKNGLDAAKSGDFETAIEIFLPLAETSDAPSQEMLGLFFEQGLGVQKDYPKAFKWTQLAAQQGLPDAQKNQEATNETSSLSGNTV